MIAIIDGLDENTGQIPLMEPIEVLVHDLPDRFPFRFLAHEPRINEILIRAPIIENKTWHSSLQDYSSELEEQNFLRLELLKTPRKRNLPVRESNGSTYAILNIS